MEWGISTPKVLTYLKEKPFGTGNFHLLHLLLKKTLALFSVPLLILLLNWRTRICRAHLCPLCERSSEKSKLGEVLSLHLVLH